MKSSFYETTDFCPLSITYHVIHLSLNEIEAEILFEQPYLKYFFIIEIFTTLM